MSVPNLLKPFHTWLKWREGAAYRFHAEGSYTPGALARLLRRQGITVLGVEGYGLFWSLWHQRSKLAYYISALAMRLGLDQEFETILAARVRSLFRMMTLERARPGQLPLPGKKWLAQHSLLHHLAMTRYDLLLRRVGLRAKPLPPLVHIDRLYGNSPEADAFRARLSALVAVHTRGASFVLLCFPLGEQLALREPLPQKTLRAHSSVLGIGFVDLHPAFVREAHERERPVVEVDGLHPTALGHDIASRERFPYLKDRCLAPGAR